ncbi:MAG: heme exporter protein CcmB, partial [Myxococcota bacterium]
GLVAPGTLYAALSARARGSDVLLPLLLFPLVVPALLSAVKSTALVLSGDPMDQLGGWMGLLAAFNLIYWSLCGLLFGRVVED